MKKAKNAVLLGVIASYTFTLSSCSLFRWVKNDDDTWGDPNWEIDGEAVKEDTKKAVTPKSSSTSDSLKDAVLADGSTSSHYTPEPTNPEAAKVLQDFIVPRDDASQPDTMSFDAPMPGAFETAGNPMASDLSGMPSAPLLTDVPLSADDQIVSDAAAAFESGLSSAEASDTFETGDFPPNPPLGGTIDGAKADDALPGPVTLDSGSITPKPSNGVVIPNLPPPSTVLGAPLPRKSGSSSPSAANRPLLPGQPPLPAPKNNSGPIPNVVLLDTEGIKPSEKFESLTLVGKDDEPFIPPDPERKGALLESGANWQMNLKPDDSSNSSKDL